MADGRGIFLVYRHQRFVDRVGRANKIRRYYDDQFSFFLLKAARLEKLAKYRNTAKTGNFIEVVGRAVGKQACNCKALSAA